MARPGIKQPYVIEDLGIDETFLPDELKLQPQLYAKYAQKAAETRRALLLKEIELDEKEALVAKDYREANAHNKVTENMVREHVRTHPEILKLKREVAELKAEYDLAVGLRTAFGQRATMLELLTRMNLGG